MTAARSKQHEEQKHTRIRTEENKRRQNKKSKRIVLKASIATKSSRLCYIAETVSSAAVEPPFREQINQNQTKLLGRIPNRRL